LVESQVRVDPWPPEQEVDPAPKSSVVVGTGGTWSAVDLTILWNKTGGQATITDATLAALPGHPRP
jgi:hypothetical protein